MNESKEKNQENFESNAWKKKYEKNKKARKINWNILHGNLWSSCVRACVCARALVYLNRPYWIEICEWEYFIDLFIFFINYNYYHYHYQYNFWKLSFIWEYTQYCNFAKKKSHTYTHIPSHSFTPEHYRKRIEKAHTIRSSYFILYFFNYLSLFVYLKHTQINVSFNHIGYTQFRNKNLLWIKFCVKIKKKRTLRNAIILKLYRHLNINCKFI